MANTKSAKKAARQNEKARIRNLARRTSIKTAVKKVLAAVEQGAPVASTQELLRNVTSQLSRAGQSGIMHPRTASRKIGRLALRVNKAAATPAA